MDSERNSTTGEADRSFVDALDLAELPDLAASDPFAGFDHPAGRGRFRPPATVNGSRPDRSTSARPDEPTTGHSDGDPAPSPFYSDGETEGLDPDDETWPTTRLSYGRHIRVLLVEADPHQAELFSQAADESVLDVQVETISTVDDTVARLERTASSRLRRQLPDVVVVSLDMGEAHRLLETIHVDTRFDGLPVLVLAESASAEAERRSFALGAMAHLVAPRRDYERVALIHALPNFMPSARAVNANLEHGR